MKIALGSVQFGIPYGIVNSNGQVEKLEAKGILDYAKSVGVDTIDTAIAYGTSEQCLGEIGVDGYHLVTKLPQIPDDYGNLKTWVQNHVESSLNTLGVETLSGLLLHRPNQLLDTDKEDLWSILLQLKSDGIVKKIGFSIYTPDELDKLWDSFKPDLVQAPYNILDRRLETSGWLECMHKENVEVHVRSIFLQGLLLMNKSKRPEKFNKWLTVWNRWDDWLKESNVTPVQAAVSFPLSDNRVSKVIVGVDSLDQLKEIISAANNNIDRFPEDFSIADTKLLNPSEWNAL
jgi:aryl-alcohol dehydrogenase-like predicted oxidoreductase